MATGENKLTASQIKKALAEKKAASLIDGRGLRLKVRKTGGASWVLRYTLNGAGSEIGLGGYPAVSLKLARDRAAIVREQVAAGQNPLETRPEPADIRKTFEEVAVEYMDNIKLPTWKHDKDDPKGSYHSWASTLRDYVYPVIGDRSINDVNQNDVDHILKPIWLEKTETATRVRQRIDNIVDYAISKKYRDITLGNPALWKNNLQGTLPDPDAFQKVKHHDSLPYELIPTFWRELQEKGGAGVCSRALAFAILTGVRTQAIREARWEQFDFSKSVWTVPAEYNKAKLEIDVPLRAAMISILEMQLTLVGKKSEYVFPQDRTPEKPISENGMRDVVRKLGYKKGNPKNGKPPATVHGFRSTAREWLAAETSHTHETSETFLGHKVGSAVTAAYFRSSGKAYPARIGAQEDWCAYVTQGEPAKYAPKPIAPEAPEIPKSILLTMK